MRIMSSIDVYWATHEFLKENINGMVKRLKCNFVNYNHVNALKSYMLTIDIYKHF